MLYSAIAIKRATTTITPIDANSSCSNDTSCILFFKDLDKNTSKNSCLLFFLNNENDDRFWLKSDEIFESKDAAHRGVV